MTNVRQRLIGEFAIRSGVDVAGIDVNGLLRALVLFDTVVLKSAGLREIPFLIRALGYADVIELLSSGALEIYCEWFSIVQNVKLNNQRTLPIGHYNFGAVDIADHRKQIHDSLQQIYALGGMTGNKAEKLKKSIVLRLIRPPSDFGKKVLDQCDRDFRSGSPTIQRAIGLQFVDKTGATPPEFNIHLQEVKERLFRAETDLFDIAHMPADATNNLIESGLAAIGNLNRRLAEMEAVSALSGFCEREIVLFEDKLSFLAKACNPAVPDAQFRRILSLAGFPEFKLEGGDRINIGRLLEIRQTRECTEFRRWVTTIDAASDAEIMDRLISIRSKLSSFVHGSEGKTMRFLASSGLGLVPVVGGVAGVVFGFVDSFLVDKLLPESGAVSFISHLYPSVFEHS